MSRPERQVSALPEGEVQIVGLHEAAEIMGIDGRQVGNLERDREAGRRKDFPAPIAKLASGPVWWREDIEGFHATRRRTPGRPAGVQGLRGFDDDQVRAALDHVRLSDRQRHVMIRRLGLDGEIPATRPQLARELGVSESTLRNDQRRAIVKLRDYLDLDLRPNVARSGVDTESDRKESDRRVGDGS